MSDEAAAALDGGRGGPVDPTWLILQRLDDLRRGQDELRAHMCDLRGEMREEIGNLRGELRQGIADLRGEVREDIRSLRVELGAWRIWTIGVLLLAILGLTVKLFFPSL